MARLFVESLGTFTAGAGAADDLYVIDGNGTGPLSRITINDSGINRIQFTGGLTIKSSIIASNTTVLTLSNDAEITISNAAQFTYIIGGTPGTGTGGTNQTYTQFATTTLGAANTSSVVNGANNILINSDGTTSGGVSPIVLPVGKTTVGTVTTVPATVAADVFTFNVGVARASIPNTQDVITGFNVANDVLRLDLPITGATTLASFLGAGTQGTFATVGRWCINNLKKTDALAQTNLR